MLVDLEAGNDGQAQVLTLGGTLGLARLDLRAELDGGLAALRSAPLRLTATLEGDDATGLGQQIGLGSDPVFDSDPMLVSLRLDGTPANSLDSRINISAGDESIGFAGFLATTDAGEVQGTGTLDMALADAGGLVQIIGAPGISLPPARARALLHFEGSRLARLTEIDGTSGDSAFSGALALAADGGGVSGDIRIDPASVEGLAAVLFAVTAGGSAVLGPTRFELIWDETRLRLARFEAALGAGTASLDLAVCCAGPLADKTVTGRLSLTNVALEAVAPPAVAAALSGTLAGGVQIEGTGASLAEVLGGLAGEGNFTVADFAAAQLSPQVFAALAGLGDVLNMEGDALRTIIAQSLEQGSFTAPTAAGAFTIAGGVLRLNNVIIDGAVARLAGDLTLGLADLGLGGDFALTPTALADPDGLIGTDTARIFNRIGGTLLAPVTRLDLDEMVAAIQVRANELEVDRLEALRAADAERQRAAAEARNQLIEAQRQRAAAEAAARAAEEEEAARQAAEAAAQRALEQQELTPAPPSPTLDGPLNLQLPPLQRAPSTGLPGN